MQNISPSNNLIKIATALNIPKYRKEHGSYIVEGFRNVKDVLDSAQVQHIIISESKADEYKDFCSKAQVYVTTDAALSKISDTKTSQGIVAIVKIPPPRFPDGELCLLLDRVRDPGNMGSILRTARAAGFCGVILNDCVDVYNPKVVRSAMSAVSKLDFCSFEGIEKIKQGGFSLVAALASGKNIFEHPLDCDKICLAIGNEANGLSEIVQANADYAVSIPMSGMESLNAAVSAAIIMYQIKHAKK